MNLSVSLESSAIQVITHHLAATSYQLNSPRVMPLLGGISVWHGEITLIAPMFSIRVPHNEALLGRNVTNNQDSVVIHFMLLVLWCWMVKNSRSLCRLPAQQAICANAKRDRIPVIETVDQMSNVQIDPLILDGVLTCMSISRSGRLGRRPCTLHKAMGVWIAFSYNIGPFVLSASAFFTLTNGLDCVSNRGAGVLVNIVRVG